MTSSSRLISQIIFYAISISQWSYTRSHLTPCIKMTSALKSSQWVCISFFIIIKFLKMFLKDLKTIVFKQFFRDASTNPLTQNGAVWMSCPSRSCQLREKRRGDSVQLGKNVEKIQLLKRNISVRFRSVYVNKQNSSSERIFLSGFAPLKRRNYRIKECIWKLLVEKLPNGH